MKKIFIGIVALVALGVSACSTVPSSNAEKDARENDERVSAESLSQLQKNQPTPKFDYSQVRQNLIELQSSQANSTVTTSFFFLEGIDHPIDSCPSVGSPIPTTMQLTNPEQAESGERGSNWEVYTLPQAEVTGVYTGQSSGTYVICIDGSGNAYANYWEGYVKTVFAPAEWDKTTGSIKIIGDPTFDFSEGK